ncbi:FAD/NAD(P)-binding domain-containing protein [Mycena kentingensis (nom. inval.)]|nr:FAD/NAD(P)-binding domain-containing protein [Mycena kentingensis (nom. inval.)]
MPPVDIAELQLKYAEERDKRLRPDGLSQFLDLTSPEAGQHKHLQDDPWADHAVLNAAPPALSDGSTTKFLILGTGYGGLLFAVRLIQAGFSTGDIRLVDDAGGFGGTWYWNRYPGIMCDVESSVYIPLLEEMGYMPKHRYGYGDELRQYAERVARKWGLEDKALFRTRCTRAEWDEGAKRWKISLTEGRGPHEPARPLFVTTQFFLLAPGTLVAPQIPRLPGLDTFAGATFHTSRWDYTVTGGSYSAPEDGLWALPRLAEKRVGIIGTGATAVQAIPQLARNAKHLYVFQRTPSSVGERGQRRVTAKEWEQIIKDGAGWQNARIDNFHMHGLGAPEAVGQPDLVDDGWTKMTTYAITGGESTSAGVGKVPATAEGIAAHVAALQEADFLRAEGIRSRVDAIVNDPTTAAALKPYHNAWCKRPTFHDDYLPAFNRPNVTLVDTDGSGVERATPTGIVVDGNEYPVDVLVLATGYRPFSPGSGSITARTGIDVLGRGGRSMEEKWLTEGCTTLQGLASNGFPNLFFMSASQGPLSSTFTAGIDMQVLQVAYIIKEAVSHAKMEDIVVEVMKEAEDKWTAQTVERAGWFAVMAGCTPGFFNNQGENDRQSAEESARSARAAPWGEGPRSFGKVLREWREKGRLEGLVVE